MKYDMKSMRKKRHRYVAEHIHQQMTRLSFPRRFIFHLIVIFFLKSTMDKIYSFKSSISIGIIERIFSKLVYFMKSIEIVCFIYLVREDFSRIQIVETKKKYLDAMPGSWFIINESQAWLRFSASQYSLGTSSFRIIYSETIRCKQKIRIFFLIFFLLSGSTVTPEADIQALDNDHLFPYRLISSPTYKSYHNLTQVIKAIVKISYCLFE